MRINPFLLSVLFCLWVTNEALAQTRPASLTVVYSVGNVAFQSLAKTGWKPLRNGQQVVVLSSAYTIKLDSRAILVVKGTNNRMVLIRDREGIHNLDRLMRTTPQDESTTVLSDYFKYLWYNLRHEHETVDTYAKAFMKRKGVVSRNEGCSTPLMITPDYGAALPTDTAITFVWKRDLAASRYTVVIYDNFDAKANTLYSTETSDTTLRFVLDKPFVKREVTYYWSVFPAGLTNCARYTFTLPKTETYRKLEVQIVGIEQMIPTDAALKAFVKAALYERNQYYPEAHRAYLMPTVCRPKMTCTGMDWSCFWPGVV